MQSKNNRRGLAIGAIFALVGSFFTFAPAANAADGDHIAIRPLSNQSTSNFSGLLTEDFGVYAQLLTGATHANSNFAAGTAYNNSRVLWEVTRVSGALDVLVLATTYSSTVSGVANVGLNNSATGRGSNSSQILVDATQKGTVFSNFTSVNSDKTSMTISARVSAGGIAPLYLRAKSSSGIVSSSPNLVVDVKVFVDELGGVNGKYDEGEWYTTQRVTLYASSRVSPTLTVGSPSKGDRFVTASATLNTINWSNLDGKLFLAVSSSETTKVFNKVTGGTNQVTSSPITMQQASARAGVVSESFTTSALTAGSKVGMQLRYLDSGSSVVNITSGTLLGPTGFTYATVADPGVDNISISSVVNANITGAGATYTVRQNQTYTVKVFASTNSVSVSKAITVSLSGTALATSSKLISINGGAYLTHYPAAGFTVTTGADGYGTFTFATSGFEAGNHVYVGATVGNTSATSVRYNMTAPAYTVVIDDTLLATTPGTAVNVSATVDDQWGELSARTDQYLKVTRAIGSGKFNFAPTISYHAVSGGVATVAFTPQGATATGSVTLTVDVVKLENGAYIDNGTEDTVTVTVTSNANDFSTGLAPTHAATVSYFPSTVSWQTITGKVDVTGSAVVISGDNVVFRKSATVPATAAGTITVASGANAQYSFQVAPLTTGDKTLTLTNGSATTTSKLIVGNVYSDYGYSITWDTTEIVAGKTRIVTGTLKDENGNAVNTTLNGSTAGDSGTASIVVTYTGTAGIVVGSMPTETDADGKFRISVLTSAADSGTLTFTAVYMPQGTSTATSKKLTSVNAVTVGAASTDSSADQKVNAGSFKGYVAVYAKGYEGQRLSAKVGNDWVVVPALASNFVRVVEFTGAGYTIAVRIYIDRVLVDTITVTTK